MVVLVATGSAAPLDLFQQSPNIKTTDGESLVIWRKKEVMFQQYFSMENILSLVAQLLEGKSLIHVQI